MSSLKLRDDREFVVDAGLKRQLDTAAIEGPTDVAQVVDADSSPALLLIVVGELVFVTRAGVRRWRPHEVKRVEATTIQLVADPPVEFAAWGAASERADFLRAVAALLELTRRAGAPTRAAVDVASEASELGGSIRERRVVRWVDTNGDLVVACVAAGLFAAMLALKPSPDCAGEVSLSLAFKIVAWGCGLGFPIATLCTLFARKSTIGKVMAFVAGVIVSLAGLITIVLVSHGPHAFQFGESDTGATRSTQSALRFAAGSASSGHAYWLGPAFQGSEIVDVQGGSSYDEVFYERSDKRKGFGAGMRVRTYRAGASPEHAPPNSTVIKVQSRTGQTVVVTFMNTTQPGEQLLQAARRAVVPIPTAVTYPGCI